MLNFGGVSGGLFERLFGDFLGVFFGLKRIFRMWKTVVSVSKNGHPLKHIFLRWVQPWGPVWKQCYFGRFKHTSRPGTLHRSLQGFLRKCGFRGRSSERCFGLVPFGWWDFCFNSLKLTKIAPKKMGPKLNPKKETKKSYSKHPFSGAITIRF